MGVYVSFAQKKFKSSAAYRFDNIMSIFYSLLNILIYMQIFRMMYGNAKDVNGITMSMLATNFVLTFIIGSAFSFNDFFIHYKVSDGSIVNEFLRPVNLKLRILAEDIGNTVYYLIFQGVPTLIIISLITKCELPYSVPSFLLFLVSIVLGYLILWSISFIVQMCSFFIINVWSISTIKNVLINILAGVYLPAWFFPDWLTKIVAFTPFDSIFFKPIQIYLGQLTTKEIVLSFAKQCFWLVILILLGDLMLKKGKKRLIVQGG